MASMRVHELAKEFDMSSKELLDRLTEMKIPAKSHASMLDDAYVDKIRKNLEPEIKQPAPAHARGRGGRGSWPPSRRRPSASAPRRRPSARPRGRRSSPSERPPAPAARGRAPTTTPRARSTRRASRRPSSPPPSRACEQQIASEKERVERERQEARARAGAEKAAAEVAKKRAVEEALRRGHKKPAKAAPAPAPARPAPAPAPSRPKNNFDSLLSQIEAEKQRIGSEQQERRRPHTPRPPAAARRARRAGSVTERRCPSSRPRCSRRRGPLCPDGRAGREAAARQGARRGPRRRGRGQRPRGGGPPQEAQGEARGRGPRARRSWRPSRRGLDPTLVLDDSVVEIPQGAHGGQVRRAAWACSPTTSSSACSCSARCSRSPSP